MSESRQELVAWVNELLDLNYTKIEQMGTGAAYCQIMDSIYGNLPMSRVKFAAKQEYAYLENYKVLQNAFTANKIDKVIPTDRLMKCKMQDNLEFLQWLKRYWDEHFPREPYNAAARRASSNNSAASAAANRSTTAPARRPMNNGAANRSMSSRGPGHSAANNSLRASPDHSQLFNLQRELQEERTNLGALEKERDFYFAKLRDIEVLIQRDQEVNPEKEENPLLREIQAVLYSTEEGFEVPQEDPIADGEYPDETF
ncbi:hypothetical protein BGZ72_001834 [Mortierella alpina]|nr:hypothetical protein BGZ72_001834 [Mortierella alpina]